MVPILCYPQTKSCQNIVVFIYFNSHLPYAHYQFLLLIGSAVRFLLRFGSVRVGLTVRTCYGSCRFGSCGSIRFTGTLQLFACFPYRVAHGILRSEQQWWDSAWIRKCQDGDFKQFRWGSTRLAPNSITREVQAFGTILIETIDILRYTI